ncbi:MAG TPA: hypothetical protein VFV24_10365 [Candidatus Eisenbacteria bacterium]|nr:hypothetical protein [Candidatus Eisenbacteria bacterium]
MVARSVLVAVTVCVLHIPVLATAQTRTESATSPSSSHSAAEFAKQLSNPVASLVSVPFQANGEFGVGPENDTRFLVVEKPEGGPEWKFRSVVTLLFPTQ